MRSIDRRHPGRHGTLDDMDLTPRTTVDGTAPRVRRPSASWLPIIVLALVGRRGRRDRHAVPHARRSTTTATSTRSASATGATPTAGSDCRAPSTKDRSGQDSGITAFTISFNGETLPVRYDGEPGGIFKECIPVVVHGVIENGELAGRPCRGEALRRVRVGERRAGRRRRDARMRRRHGRRMTSRCVGHLDSRAVLMFAASVNAAVGRAGLMLMLGASVFGAIRRAVRHPARRHEAAAPESALCVARASPASSLSVVMMQRALITRDFSMAYVQQVGSADTPALYNVAAMWSALEGSILLWALVLDRLHRGGRLAIPQAHRRRPRRLGADRDVRRHGLLRAGQLRPGRPVRRTVRPASRAGRGRTRCCRTTSWCCSTRRSSTSATSGSPCRSPSRSQRSSPAGSARDG